jgi:hypothetical protein
LSIAYKKQIIKKLYILAYTKVYFMNMKEDVFIGYSNYKTILGYFYENYKDICFKISAKTNINELNEVRVLITTFIYDSDYGIRDQSKIQNYRKKLKDLLLEWNDDKEIKNTMGRDLSIITNKIQYQVKYYQYFLKYLSLLGSFTSELTETLMPNTNVQKKYLRFFSTEVFQNKFLEHRKYVVDALSQFKLSEFSICFNKLITFYSAYSLFINQADKVLIDKLFTYLISYYLNWENLNTLGQSNPSNSQHDFLTHNSQVLSEALLFVNSLLNASFSSLDILPKIETKVYNDRTLI